MRPHTFDAWIVFKSQNLFKNFIRFFIKCYEKVQKAHIKDCTLQNTLLI